jgi:putative endonuclease
MAAYVYVMSNESHTLYVGSTEDLLERVRQHKLKLFKNSFTARYHFDRLVYFEVVLSRELAEARERQIKGWKRSKKVALIQAMNPNWLDLSPRLSDLSFLA